MANAHHIGHFEWSIKEWSKQSTWLGILFMPSIQNICFHLYIFVLKNKQFPVENNIAFVGCGWFHYKAV